MSRLTQATRLLGLLTFWLVLTDGLIDINLLEPFVSRHREPPHPSLPRSTSRSCGERRSAGLGVKILRSQLAIQFTT